MNGLPASTVVLLAVIAAIPPTITALAAFVMARRTQAKVAELHVEVNDRLTQLLKSTHAEASATGELKGAEDERQRQT